MILGFFCFIDFPYLPPPPQELRDRMWDRATQLVENGTSTLARAINDAANSYKCRHLLGSRTIPDDDDRKGRKSGDSGITPDLDEDVGGGV